MTNYSPTILTRFIDLLGNVEKHYTVTSFIRVLELMINLGLSMDVYVLGVHNIGHFVGHPLFNKGT